MSPDLSMSMYIIVKCNNFFHQKEVSVIFWDFTNYGYTEKLVNSKSLVHTTF